MRMLMIDGDAMRYIYFFFEGMRYSDFNPLFFKKALASVLYGPISYFLLF